MILSHFSGTKSLESEHFESAISEQLKKHVFDPVMFIFEHKHRIVVLFIDLPVDASRMTNPVAIYLFWSDDAKSTDWVLCYKKHRVMPHDNQISDQFEGLRQNISIIWLLSALSLTQHADGLFLSLHIMWHGCFYHEAYSCRFSDASTFQKIWYTCCRWLIHYCSKFLIIWRYTFEMFI